MTSISPFTTSPLVPCPQSHFHFSTWAIPRSWPLPWPPHPPSPPLPLSPVPNHIISPPELNLALCHPHGPPGPHPHSPPLLLCRIRMFNFKQLESQEWILYSNQWMLILLADKRYPIPHLKLICEISLSVAGWYQLLDCPRGQKRHPPSWAKQSSLKITAAQGSTKGSISMWQIIKIFNITNISLIYLSHSIKHRYFWKHESQAHSSSQNIWYGSLLSLL